MTLDHHTIPGIIREIHHAAEHGHHAVAAELEAVLDAPITVLGCEYTPCHTPELRCYRRRDVDISERLYVHETGWGVMMSTRVNEATVYGDGATPEQAIAACDVSRTRRAVDALEAHLRGRVAS